LDILPLDFVAALRRCNVDQKVLTCVAGLARHSRTFVADFTANFIEWPIFDKVRSKVCGKVSQQQFRLHALPRGLPTLRETATITAI
jgi:hypothetical protein